MAGSQHIGRPSQSGSFKCRCAFAVNMSNIMLGGYIATGPRRGDGGKGGRGGAEGCGEEVPEEQSLEVGREQGWAEVWSLLWYYYTALDPVSKGPKGGRTQMVLTWTQQAVL